MPLLLGVVSLSGCANTNNNSNSNTNQTNTNSNNNTNSNSNNNGNEKKTETHDPGTPDWWVKLFTLDNVTMTVTRTSPFAEVKTYKYIDSKYYIQSSDTGEYILSPDSDYDYGFDFRCHYQTFQMQQTDETCSITGWKKYDDNDWIYDEVITVANGKLVSIGETSSLGATSIYCLTEFTNWGTTTIA